ncbi:MAG: PAS domain S-box protein [Anaerolineae bacterium]|nr:PAS domain S-box protein [Anaerolineae bacterium]
MRARAQDADASTSSEVGGLNHANRSLREELESLRALFDSLPLGIYRMAPNGKILLANAAVQKLVARASETRLPLLCPPPNADTTGFYRSLLEDDPTCGGAQGLEGEVQIQGGRSVYVRENIRIVRGPDGSPQHYDCTIEDITDRHRAEDALRVSEERYRSVVEHSPAGILLVDDQARIIFANRETSRILGLEPSQVIGRHFTDFLHPDSRKIVLERYANRQRGDPVPARYEAQIRHADGTSRDVVLSATTFETKAGIARTAAQILDVTDRTKVEQALRDYTEALEIRNAELDAFADSVAHDLKNPLSTIIGFAEVLLEQLDTLAEEDVRRVLRSISAMGRKMDGIIDELLIFSRIRRTAVQPSPVDMQSVVESVLDRLQRPIAEHQVVICKPKAWPQALGHGPWIEEVWANYISNAIAYGGDPPVVELGANLLPDGRVRFWVRDNGDGVPPGRQPRIFDGLSDRALGGGHGLGLSIVKRIVNKLGGEVSVQSSGKAGEGSIFSFTLPAALVAEDSATS